MEKKMNNKGFSLVELIIVIAIMAVLIGVLAPQYLKYVKKSKYAADVQTAEELAVAINVAIADGQTTPSTFSIADVENVGAWPTSKTGGSFAATFDSYGLATITIDGDEAWPDSADFMATGGF